MTLTCVHSVMNYVEYDPVYIGEGANVGQEQVGLSLSRPKSYDLLA